MKNLFKVFGVIAMVAVIGFSTVACSNGSTDDEVDGEGVNYSIRFEKSNSGDWYVLLYFDALAEENEEAVIETLTMDDIVFTPNDILSKDSIPVQSSQQIQILVTKLKAGTVTITVPEKDGVVFKLLPGEENVFTVTMP